MASKAILAVMRLAQRGDPESQFKLGCVYLDGGEGLPAHERTAYRWLRSAARQGHEAAVRTIGDRISVDAADRDPMLRDWFKQSATAGSVPAKRKLAQWMLEEARAIAPAPIPADVRALLTEAADAGDAEAARDLGRLLLGAPTGQSDEAVGIRMLEQSFRHGHREVARLLADHYWKEREPQLARHWYRCCAESYDAEVCYRLGLLGALFGQPDDAMLETAAEAGHLNACELLGLRLATGSAGHRRNLKKAARWLEIPANRGSREAAFVLATLHRHSALGVRDGRRARQWLFRAARLGHGEACLKAGKLLIRAIEYGHGLKFDDIDPQTLDLAAATFLSSAAQQGFDEAREHLRRIVREVPPSMTNDTQAWSAFIAAVERKDAELGARLKLGRALGLTARELLAVDPARCDFRSAFVVDVEGRRTLRRRIVLIETDAQRQDLDEAETLLDQIAMRRKDTYLLPDFRSRYLKLRHLVRLRGTPMIEAALFPRSTGTPKRHSGPPRRRATA